MFFHDILRFFMIFHATLPDFVIFLPELGDDRKTPVSGLRFLRWREDHVVETSSMQAIRDWKMQLQCFFLGSHFFSFFFPVTLVCFAHYLNGFWMCFVFCLSHISLYIVPLWSWLEFCRAWHNSTLATPGICPDDSCTGCPGGRQFRPLQSRGFHLVPWLAAPWLKSQTESTDSTAHGLGMFGRFGVPAFLYFNHSWPTCIPGGGILFLALSWDINLVKTCWSIGLQAVAEPLCLLFDRSWDVFRR